ncbi:methyltransferase [Aliidiomarina sp.]|uniref:methyltransferase n=1 Tax=Aliidiomarina sp. TaxID=1872439 RepID=UPI003A4D85A3
MKKRSASSTNEDRAFTSDVHRFDKNIYQTEKGQIREAVLAADLRFLLADVGADESSEPKRSVEKQPSRSYHPRAQLSCLDVGAGLGQLNTYFARAGYTVTHTDISAEMIVAAKSRHSAQELEQHYTYHQVGLQELASELGEQQFNVVLCHAVLEWLADPFAALAVLQARVKPGGWLSLMFYNNDAKRMANILYGNFDYVNAGLKVKKKVRFSPNYPLQPQQVVARLGQYPLTLISHSGVRCFHDYMRAKEYSAEELLALELTYRQQSPYRELGRYQHLLLRKDSK